MASTTNNQNDDQQEVVVSKKVTHKDIKHLYQKGESLYSIARQVYGFESDEAIENIRAILGIGVIEEGVKER